MARGNILKNINLFFEGVGYAGKVEEVTLPKLKQKTEEFRAGGMDGPVDITQGMEKLTADFTVRDCSPRLLGALTPREGSSQSFVMRGAYEQYQGSRVIAREVIMRGKVTEIDGGTSKPGEGQKIKISMTLDYYSDTFDGQLVTEIDVINMIYMRDGGDVMADIRDALGM